MKKIILISLLLTGTFFKSQAQVFLASNAKVQFFSETPLENISAINSSVNSLINAGTDSVLVKMKNTAFSFKNALMQDHFNENYMESSKYPYSIFRGKINQHIDFTKEGIYPVSATGKMTIHGVEKPTTLTGTLMVKGSEITLKSEFYVRTADFHIEIPKLVFEKIAEQINVKMNAVYTRKK